MNDLASKLRKGGIWVWNQKEKMVLFALLIFLCYRVYVVLISPPDLLAQGSDGVPGSGKSTGTTPTKPPATATPAKLPAAPPQLPVLERADDWKPLVRQNPFTIYGMMQGTAKTGGTTEETIDVVLNRILKWRDGTYRAEMTTKVSGRPKYYKEGEPFESYKLMSIDAANGTVTIFSTGHDRTFVLKAQGS